MKIVKMKYIGAYPRRFYMFGIVKPDEIVYVPCKESKKILETKLFEMVEDFKPIKVKVKNEIAKKEDCVNCPKKDGE